MKPYRLRTRLVASLIGLVALVVVSAGAALATALACGRAMSSAHRYESAARKAAALGRLAREQYIHEAHTIILGDRSHVGHHDTWVHRFRDEASAFRADLPEETARRVDEILVCSDELAAIFANEIVPAVSRGDRAGVRAAHDRANQLVDEMTSHADTLADALELRASAAEHEAERASRLMRGVAGVACVLAAAFAFGVARRLWTGLGEPLRTLEDVSGRVTNGDRSARVGPLAAAELAKVGSAFDAMLDALALQERSLVSAERFATLGRVAAGVAHEINNPITIIRGYASRLRKDPRADAVRDEVEIVDEEAAACQRIAEDLLAYTRAPALDVRVADARALAEEAVEKCVAGSPDARARAIAIDVAPADLRVDPIRIRQVLVNLLRNAMQADAGTIEVIGRRDGAWYVFRVRDRGPGFSADAREHLFEPFYTTRKGGSGLGLAVSFGLVAAHHGMIRADNLASGGAEIVVELPLDEEHADA